MENTTEPVSHPEQSWCKLIEILPALYKTRTKADTERSGSELRWTGKLREYTWTGIAALREDEDFEYDSQSEGSIDHELEEDSGDREFVDLQSAPEVALSGQSSRVEAPRTPFEAESERIYGKLVETPMRRYYVVNMTWDVRRCANEENNMAATTETPKAI